MVYEHSKGSCELWLDMCLTINLMHRGLMQTGSWPGLRGR